MSMMSSKSPSRASGRVAWSSVAFIVESMLLLVFLVGSLAVLTQLFSSSLNRSVESRTLDAATIAATSIAEHFAANPNDVQESTQLGDLIVKCDVTPEQRKAGTLYHATISVLDSASGKTVYEMDTSCFESEVK